MPETEPVTKKKPKRRSDSLPELPPTRRHFFVRDARHFPVACVTTCRIDGEAQSKLTYAVSVCNPLDFQRFNPRLARELSAERLRFYLAGKYDDMVPSAAQPDFESAMCGVVMFGKGESPKLVLLNQLSRDNDLPGRLRRAAVHEIAILKQKMEARAKAAEVAVSTATGEAPSAGAA